jgi:hypothetical protein
MENHHFSWENPLLMAIFNSYVKLPEGIQKITESKGTIPRFGGQVSQCESLGNKASGFSRSNGASGDFSKPPSPSLLIQKNNTRLVTEHVGFNSLLIDYNRFNT